MTTLLTAAQVAERLGVSDRYVYGLGRKGVLPRITLPGDVVRFDEADVNGFIAAHRQEGRPQREVRQDPVILERF